MKSDIKNVRLMSEAYLSLQKLSNADIDFAIQTDSIRASLRNRISEITGVSCQQTQEYFERLAHK